MDEREVWAPDAEHGYVQGKVIDVGSHTLTVQPLNGGKTISASYDRIFPCEDDITKSYDDNCGLMYLNEGNLLNNLKVRFAKDIFYTYVANILIAVNPCKTVPNLYGAEVMKTYRGKSLGTMAPHVFALADKTFRDMRTQHQSQSIVVSGESGAGKTETTKYIIRYLTALTNSGTTASQIETRLVESNPFLESFGNAKTTRNNNSSRFGKFMEIHFCKKGNVSGGFVSHYLLEKSRIVSQSSEERNYHAFYRLTRAPESWRKKFDIQGPEHYNYLKGSSLSDDHHDTEGFASLLKSMDCVGLSDQEKENVFRVVAGVLHLGNINFEAKDSTRGGSVISGGSMNELNITSKLFNLEPDALIEALTTRVMMTKGGGVKGTVIGVPLKPEQAANGRDALAKAIYSNLFDHIVHRVNECFPFTESENFIGVLDIAGFEYFKHNSFEQFCINYCNEKLQQFFNDRIIKQEQSLYETEGLGVKFVEYVDNQDCIDLIEAKKSGILDLLDEECRLPSASVDHFTTAVHTTHKDHFRLSSPRRAKLAFYKGLRDSEGFVVRHYAGAVCYETGMFLDKNNNSLHDNLEMLMQQSEDDFVMKIFPMKKLASESSSKKGGKKLMFNSLAAKFKTQLSSLLEKLGPTGASFIRCLKTNFKIEPGVFNGGQVLSQLQCAGMVTVLGMMQGGFPSRTGFQSLYDMYKDFLPAKLASLEPRTFCQALFMALGLDVNDFKFGMTKVFFRPGKFAEFDQIIKADPDNLKVLVSRVSGWLNGKRWRKAQWGVLSCIKLSRKIQYRLSSRIILQSLARGFITRRRNLPRVKGFSKFQLLQQQLSNLKDLLAKLDKYRDSQEGKFQELKGRLDTMITKMRAQPVTQDEIDSKYRELSSAVDAIANDITNTIQKEAEEAEKERLRVIQDELERERKRKEEEERKRKQEEEERKERERILFEMEVQRKREEAEARIREEEEKKRQAEEEERDRIERQRHAEEEARRLASEEQERRDRELAERLAQDAAKPQDVLEKEPEPAAETSRIAATVSSASAPATTGNKLPDLSKWKYEKLKEVISSGTDDVELLAACRDEFHRRLKVYHAWKVKNKKKGANVENKPDQLAAKKSSGFVSNKQQNAPRDQRAQRYFRVPFIRPEDRKNSNCQKGWWFAHFDGSWIARQMELHPERSPVLYVAGRDDLKMCELSLEETGLARKKGAEILPEHFAELWKKHSGPAYAGK